MKVDSTTPVRSARLRRSGGKTGASSAGSFADELTAGAGEPAATPEAPQVGAVPGLLALQEVGTASDGRSRGLLRGQDLLDRLEDIRLGLLAGAIAKEDLRALSAAVGAQRAAVDDPRLNEILDEIELRAEVELAKLGG